MIDLVLLISHGVVFAGGFWAGKTYGSTSAMLEAARTKVRSWL